jgi:hypothetical protein
MQDSRMRAFLLGLGMLPIGWVLFEVLGGRSSQEQYRSDEDLYIVLSLAGVLILAIGIVCILTSIYQWLKEVIRTW